MGLIDVCLNFHPLEDGKRILLYASTLDKKLAKEFERTHCMDAFMKKVVQSSDFDEDIAEHEMHATNLRTTYLRYTETKYITAVLTGVEVWNIENMSEIIMDYLAVHMISYEIFEDDVAEALRNIGYADTYHVLDPNYEFGDEPYLHRKGLLLWKNELGGFGWMYDGIADIAAIMERGDKLDEESVVSIRRC